MTVTADPFYTWVQELGPIYPTRPSTYGADPHRPDPHSTSRFEGMAALKGGWTPTPKPKAAKKRTRRQRRRR